MVTSARRTSIKAGIDWGSSSFRAYKFDEMGCVTDTVSSSAGIKTIVDQNFEVVLHSAIGHWLEAGDEVLLSGMITSRHGWIETPYLECPVKLERLYDNAVSHSLSHQVRALFLPGVCVRSPAADVMRGEELQLYGALNHDEQVVVLPGTHSKWASLSQGVLKEFRTVITGELFDLLRNQSLVGALATSDQWVESSFVHGVREGYSSENIITRLFSARSSVLLEQLEANAVHSYLSGLLIGNEISEMDTMLNANPVMLVGSESLVASYLCAFNALSIAAMSEKAPSAAEGFSKLIKRCADKQ